MCAAKGTKRQRVLKIEGKKNVSREVCEILKRGEFKNK